MSRQAPDRLILDGRERMLISEPLESLIRDFPTRPDFRIEDGVNTRGYVATWEVRPDDTLWLIRLQTRLPDDGPDPGLQLVFPDSTGPIAATWVTLKLVSPDGNRRYDHRGYVSTYARETTLMVHEGRVVVIEELRSGTGQRSSERLTSHLEAIFGAEEGAFLRAVHAAPDDSAPRLVYADWLEERGDARANLIRLQERIRGLAPEDAQRERDAHVEVLRRALSNGLWNQLMRYAEHW
jgi:uncharacterized protein (TIGR02996 family)